MNKHFLLCAAAVFSNSTADAGTPHQTFTFASSGGDVYCTGGTIYTSGASVWSVQFNNCSNSVTYGQGLVGKLKATGKSVNVSDNFFGQVYGIFSEYISFTVPSKIEFGKPWELWIGMNGTTSFLADSGIIYVDDKVRRRSGRSLTAKLIELIKEHRSHSKA